MTPKAWLELLDSHGVNVADGTIILEGADGSIVETETLDVLRLKFSRGAEAQLVSPLYDRDNDAHFGLGITTTRIDFDDVFLKWFESATETGYDRDRGADTTQTIASEWIFPWSELVGMVFETRERKQFIELSTGAADSE